MTGAIKTVLNLPQPDTHILCAQKKDEIQYCTDRHKEVIEIWIFLEYKPFQNYSKYKTNFNQIYWKF